jgi:hypothetical protein
VLLRVAGKGDALLAIEAVEQHAHFHRGEVLDLVDGHVSVAQRPLLSVAQWSHAQLPGAQ